MASLKEQKFKIKERASKGSPTANVTALRFCKRMRIQPAAAPDFMLFCSCRNLFIGNLPKADKANTRSFSASLSN